MIRGIDISHHTALTPEVLNNMVQTHELYFCYLKASEGATIQDDKFVSYWQMCRNAGLLCGGYHFLRPLTDPLQQAQNFLSQYKMVSRNGVLPPVVDIEWAYVGTAPNQKEQWTQLAAEKRVPLIKAFLSQVEQQLNVTPVIYTAVGFWNEFIKPQLSVDDTAYFATHPLWIVDLKGTTQFPSAWRRASFIQTHFGETATTKDPYDVVDQDSFNGSTLKLLNMTSGGLTITKSFPRSFIVRDMQAALHTAGFLNDAPDGIFGNHTKTAVSNFQLANGLVANGIVDTQTWNKILANKPRVTNSLVFAP
jgi:lysozyme